MGKKTFRSRGNDHFNGKSKHSNKRPYSNEPKKPKFDTSAESPAIQQDLGTRPVAKRLTIHDMRSFKPMTDTQTDFFRSFYGTSARIFSLCGCAGTGKTFLALAAALSEVLDPTSVYEKVVIVRSAVEVRKSGFLPGSEAEKHQPYEDPYHGIVKELFPQLQEPFNLLKSTGQIVFRSTNFSRGITIDDAIIVVDEAQNMDFGELSTITTRTGVNTKIIFAGDVVQDDLRRHREVSGYSKQLSILKSMPGNLVECFEFQPKDIVRDPIVKAYILACMEYEKKE